MAGSARPTLTDKIKKFLAEPETLEKMEEASRSLAKPDAAREIVEGCLELIKDD